MTFYIHLVTSSVIGKFRVIRRNVKSILLDIWTALLVKCPEFTWAYFAEIIGLSKVSGTVQMAGKTTERDVH